MAAAALAQLILAMQKAPPPAQNLLARYTYASQISNATDGWQGHDYNPAI